MRGSCGPRCECGLGLRARGGWSRRSPRTSARRPPAPRHWTRPPRPLPRRPPPRPPRPNRRRHQSQRGGHLGRVWATGSLRSRDRRRAARQRRRTTSRPSAAPEPLFASLQPGCRRQRAAVADSVGWRLQAQCRTRVVVQRAPHPTARGWQRREKVVTFDSHARRSPESVSFVAQASCCALRECRLLLVRYNVHVCLNFEGSTRWKGPQNRSESIKRTVSP